MARPDLLRSWISDAIGVFDEDHLRHDLAQTWQQPGVGEQAAAQMLGGSPPGNAARLVSFGFPQDVAEQVAAGRDDDMGRALLAFYRSAAQPAMAEAGRSLEAAAARPGLALLASEDPFVGTGDQRRRAAARAGAGSRCSTVSGTGGWWRTHSAVPRCSSASGSCAEPRPPQPGRRTRKRRLVRGPMSSTPSFSSARGGVPSNSRSPAPSRTGMTSTRSSSTRPASSS